MHRLAGFAELTDIVLVCDSGDNQKQNFEALCRQITKANKRLAVDVYPMPSVQNIVQTAGTPRLHALMIPMAGNGGLESICVEVARTHQNKGGKNIGTIIEGWVNTFADSACQGWTIEKRDKLRLQAFMSACYKKKPDLHFSQLFEITKNDLVPLDGPEFDDIRVFLKSVEFVMRGFLATRWNAASKSLMSSDACTCLAVSTKRLYRSASVSFGGRGCFSFFIQFPSSGD